MTDLVIADHRVADVRIQTSLDDLAEALTFRANLQVQHGLITDAQRDLDEAAAIHHVCGRPYDEARCTQFAATLCRLAGQFEEAKVRAQRAAYLVGNTGPIAVAATTELGEIAMVKGDAAAASTAYAKALKLGTAAGLGKAEHAALLRRHASALVNIGEVIDAARKLEDAQQLLAVVGDSSGALQIQVEQATVLFNGGKFQRAKQICQRALRSALELEDHVALANIRLLQSAIALQARKLREALNHAHAAQQSALASVAPVQYVAATLAIAEVSERLGDQAGAYAALAVGWVTLSDLSGHELARAAFEPKLIAMREHWGIDIFLEVKSAYEMRRRAAAQQA